MDKNMDRRNSGNTRGKSDAEEQADQLEQEMDSEDHPSGTQSRSDTELSQEEEHKQKSDSLTLRQKLFNDLQERKRKNRFP